MSKADGTVERLLRTAVTPLLRKVGFRKVGLYYFRQRSGNWELVQFQKSWSNTVDETRFTVNCGIVSTRLARFLLGADLKMPTPEYNWHYSQRLGFLMAGGQDKWWTIDASVPKESLGSEVSELIIDLAIPTLDAHASDEELRDLWLSGESPGLTDVQRLMYLAVLLRDLSPREQYSSILSELEALTRKRPIGVMVSEHLHQLNRDQ